jgi:4-amino-4-deoxy-L-arabinose transferase-like glycosyltransferase
MKSNSIITKKFEILFLILIVSIGAFLRLYRIDKTMMFLGDQGRDAIIAKNILKDGDIALIGPVTSVGNMYLGPFYYYFMVPWLALTYPSPVGPTIGVALVGVATIPLLYFITKKMFSKRAAIFATTLFSVSTTVVSQVRFSWNPNLAPILGLLIFYSLYLAIKKNQPKYITFSIILYALIIQLHYVAILLAGAIGAVCIYQFVSKPKNRKNLISNTLLGLLLLVISTIPLIVFDARHDGLIQQGFSKFFTSTEEHIRPLSRLGQMIQDLSGNTYKLTTQIYGTDSVLEDQLGLAIIIIGIFLAYKNFNKSKKVGLNLLLFWFLVCLGAMGLYSSSIFPHYLSFTQAVTFILLGVVFTQFSKKSKLANILVYILSLIIIITNLKTSPGFAKAPSQLEVAKITSESIYSRVLDNEKYNIVLISGTGDIDAQNYRYFLETTDRPPVIKERRGEVETLFIIQDSYFDTNPVDSPIYEIVVFPNKTPAYVYTVDNGPTITVLKVNHDQ